MNVVAANAQEIKATVSVNYDLISPERREDVLTMQQDVMRYLNTQSFTGKEFKNEADKLRWKDEPVEIDVSITLMSRTDNSYAAQLLINAKRAIFDPKGASKRKTVTLLFLDKKWGFEYSRGSELTYNSFRFDKFSSLLDFYVFTLLGMDLDSYYELGGSDMYQRALQICQSGASASGATGYQLVSEPGELTRYNIISDLNDARYDDFRKMLIDYYITGLDGMSENKQKALEDINGILTRMTKFKDKMTNRSAIMQIFFDSKYRELCDLFKGTAMAEKVFEKLKYLDLSHGQSYEMARQGK